MSVNRRPIKIKHAMSSRWNIKYQWKRVYTLSMNSHEELSRSYLSCRKENVGVKP